MEQRTNAESTAKLVMRVRDLVVGAAEAQDGADGRALLESALVELEVLRERMTPPVGADERSA